VLQWAARFSQQGPFATMPLPFLPACLGIVHGALPHRNPGQAQVLLNKTTPVITAWPQLPLRSFREQEYVQAAAGFPGLVYDGVQERVYVDRSLLDQSLDKLSLAYLQNDAQASALGVEDAAGLSELLRIANQGLKARAIKGQMVGPVSLGMLLTDEQQRPLMYEAMLLDALVQHLHLRARWQVERFDHLVDATIICLEEPFLEAVESPFVPINWEDALDLIERVYVGVDCCRGLVVEGNLNWKQLLASSIELFVVNTATQFEPLLAAEGLEHFFERGGMIAWGVVPSESDTIAQADLNSLFEQTNALFERIVARGIVRERLLSQSLITTMTNLARVSVEEAERAMDLVFELSRKLREPITTA
jgi:hypothetical protein